jgi:hypothetical protein
MSRVLFVWVAPTLLRGGPYLKIEENSLRGAKTLVNNVVDSNPAHVKHEKRCKIYFRYLENASTWKK